MLSIGKLCMTMAQNKLLDEMLLLHGQCLRKHEADTKLLSTTGHFANFHTILMP